MRPGARPVQAFLISAALLAAVPAVAGNASPPASGFEQNYREGENALSMNAYGKAEKYLQAALSEAEKFGPKDLRLAKTLHMLASLYSARGQFNRAEPLLERELRVREQCLGGESPDVVSTVGKMCQFYLAHGTAGKADRLTALLLSFSDRKLKEQQTISRELSHLEKLYAKHKGYAEAGGILKQLEASTSKARANENLELATTLDGLGHLYEGQSKQALAEQLYKNALLLRESGLPPGHLALAASYDSMGNLYNKQGKQELAQTYFKKAFDVTEQTLQPQRPEVFSRVDNLAKSYVTLNQLDSAESLYKRALIMLGKQGNGRDVGLCSQSLAELYCKLGKFDLAEPLYKRALQIAESNNGPQHACLAPVLDSYADVLEKVNKSGDAAKMRTRAKSIRGSLVVDSSADF